jgi:ubiquinone biosynthesis protein
MLGQPWKRWQRGKEILRTFSRYGFDWLLSLRLDGKTAAARFQAAGDSFPRMMESLGPVFIKLGQNLAARPGLFEEPIMDALARVEDRGEARPFSALRSFLGDQLGTDPATLFSSFRDEPVTSSSTEWVYRAKLKTDREVALKVRRPGIERLIEVDLDLLLRTVRFIERHTSWLAGPEARETLEEIRKRLKQDLYLLEEGRNCERLQKNLSSFPQIRIPAVFWEYSSPDLLTLEALEGVKLSRPDALSKAPVSPTGLGETLASLYLKQILVDGFFHACPSLEKLALDGEGRLILQDYKAFHCLSPAGTGLLKGLISAMYRRDAEKIGSLLIDSRGGKQENGRAFSLKLQSLLNQEEYAAGRSQMWGGVFSSVVHLAKEAEHPLPKEVLSAGETLSTLEKTLGFLSPKVRFLELAASVCGNAGPLSP